MAMLYEALAQACRRNHQFAIVATTEDVPRTDRLAAETLLARKVDGLVLSTAREDDDFPDVLARRGVPYVLALRTDGKSLSSVGDDELGGYLATRHLLDLGHRTIGLITGPMYASSARGRRAGYRRALKEAGIAADPRLLVDSSFSIEAGVEATRVLMTLNPTPTAIFAVNDNTAVGALSALNTLGLTVPDDVSLVGYNDIPIASKLPMPLTTVRVPFDQIAESALDLLTDPPTGEQPRTRVATPTLIPRRSTAPLRR
jgi:LacI family transcriptional regulator